jgi:hypothetical protein
MNLLIEIAEGSGVLVGPLNWFILTVLGYFVLGFGGMTFDFSCNRFRNSGNGQFVKWEFAVLGGFIELFFIITLICKMGVCSFRWFY